MTDVIFRAWLGTKNVIAFFPGIPGTPNGADVLAYENAETRPVVRLETIKGRTRKAGPEEYRELLAELRNYYPDLRVVKRFTKAHRRERERTKYGI